MNCLQDGDDKMAAKAKYYRIMSYKGFTLSLRQNKIDVV